jgi:hypothetical protein
VLSSRLEEERLHASLDSEVLREAWLASHRSAGNGDALLEDNLNDFEPETVKNMVRLQHERSGDESVDDGGAASRPMILGFALELPEETAQLQIVVEEFATALDDAPPIFHGAKFEDPVLRSELAKRAEEIFALEMKLSRVLTLIYLHANQEGDPYDLLLDETVQPTAKDKPVPEQMRAAAENQFFHHIFSQYIDLNRRPGSRLRNWSIWRSQLESRAFRRRSSSPQAMKLPWGECGCTIWTGA